jgi:serine/threonine protein kinase
MSAQTDNNGPTYEARLSKLESHLASHADDEAMVAEIGTAMRALLSGHGESEATIRQVLQRQFDQGNLRTESYELVERLLDKLVAEKQAEVPAESVTEATYVDTAVIEPPVQARQAKDQSVTTTRLQIGSVLRDRFLLKEQVAEGSMGTVYKALDRRLAETGDSNPYVAIKVVNPKLARNSAALRALQQEAAKGRCLSHPNIVRFIDLDREDDLFFIVMEWLEGLSLSKILDENRDTGLDMSTAMGIVRQVSRALDYAHLRGVVHADVKPGNIIITPKGEVKLIDFGVARVRQKENEGKSRFDPNVMRGGAPAYSSMQVLTGEDPVPADDVFSLACLLYRLVAGYRVFGPRNAADAAEEGMEPQPPQQLSPQQWQAVKKALSYSRVTRFASPKAFMDAFGSDAMAEPAKTAPPPGQPVTAAPAAASTEVPNKLSPTPLSRSDLIAADETTEIAMDLPPLAGRETMRAERDSIMYDRDDDERRRGNPWRLIILGIILVASAAVFLKPELIEDLTGVKLPFGPVNEIVDGLVPTNNAAQDSIQELEALPEVDVAQTVEDDFVEELAVEPGDQSARDIALPDNEIVAGNDAAPAPEALPEAIDFSLLPEPELLLSIDSASSSATPEGEITLREGGSNAIVDLVRGGDLAQEMTVQFVVAGSSANQPVGQSAQFTISDQGLMVFGIGQPRARIEIAMNSDEVREPDSQVTLKVQNVDDLQTTLATIRLVLEDDDQRAFESGLAVNTVGFSVQEVTVREFDPAVRLDIARYRSDNAPLEIPFKLVDVTATEGQDYFAPGITMVYFGAGENTARILIPLGQDARPEENETFRIELETAPATAGSNIFSQITVIIRDDDS